MSYLPHERRPEGQWVVALFPPSAVKSWATVRLYPTMDLCTEWWSRSSRFQCIFSERREMEARLSVVRTLDCLNALESEYPQHAPDDSVSWSREDSPEYLSGLLWDFCQRSGDRVSQSPHYAEVEETMVVVKLDLMKSAEGRRAWDRLPRQGRIIAQGLIDLDKDKATPEELEAVAKRLWKSGILRTRQDPARIFQYYAVYLADMGMIVSPRRRKGEDGAEG